MWNKVGIFRNEDGITEALKEIDQLIEDYKTCYVGDPERTYNMAFVNYCEIGSMLTVAKAIAMGAYTVVNLVVLISVKTIQNVMMKRYLKTLFDQIGC